MARVPSLRGARAGVLAPCLVLGCLLASAAASSLRVDIISGENAGAATRHAVRNPRLLAISSTNCSGIVCKGKCVNPTLDTSNCGGCGVTCPTGQVCYIGKCQPCGPFQRSCNGSCVPIRYDNNNCGGCGIKCTNGTVCYQFGCKCPPGYVRGEKTGNCIMLQTRANCAADGNACKSGEDCINYGLDWTTGAINNTCTKLPTCPNGGSKCVGPFNDNQCHNLQTDVYKCGGCRFGCNNGPGYPLQVCTKGKCACVNKDETICNGNTLDGDGWCYNLKNSTRACGKCGVRCPSGSVCVNGQCTCPNNTTGCPMAMESQSYSLCTDLLTDVYNCGTCKKKCQGVCVSGICQPCPANTTFCDGKCLNLKTDSTNCGACGVNCGQGQCINGTCGCQDPTLKACPTLAWGIGVTCVNLKNDTYNCGGCANYCEVCKQGKCSCKTPGYISCNGVCANPKTDVGNCGKCGNLCPMGQYCAAGKCAPSAKCGWGSVGCGSKCSSLATTSYYNGHIYYNNNYYLSGCYGALCNPSVGDYAVLNCSGSSCTGRCSDPQEIIDAFSGSNSCSDFMTDNSNCGGCGIQCEAGSCINGKCTCDNPGWTVCPALNIFDVAKCKDLKNDNQNCGKCGNVCARNFDCIKGQCTTQCKRLGYAACNGTCTYVSTDQGAPPPDGSPARVLGDSNNCGGCNKTCPLSAPVCTFTSTKTPKCACVGTISPSLVAVCNGTCTDLYQDPNNCGGCGNKCLRGDAWSLATSTGMAQGSQSCMTGVCVLDEPSPFFNPGRK